MEFVGTAVSLFNWKDVPSTLSVVYEMANLAAIIEVYGGLHAKIGDDYVSRAGRVHIQFECMTFIVHTLQLRSSDAERTNKNCAMLPLRSNLKKNKKQKKKKTNARITERVFGEDITKDVKWKSVHVSLYTYINFDSDVFLFTSSCDEW